jgi:hypothetical protein
MKDGILKLSFTLQLPEEEQEPEVKQIHRSRWPNHPPLAGRQGAADGTS